jgi:hypothetical protein
LIEALLGYVEPERFQGAGGFRFKQGGAHPATSA